MNPTPQDPQHDPKRPFFGLASFGEADAALFFGRDAEQEELLARVRRETLTVLFGASGLGKSSLLQAGLVPRLRAGRLLPVALRLDYSPQALAPAAQIRERLAQEAARGGAEVVLKGEADPAALSLWEFLHRARFWDALNQPLTPVLIFDQFEELFTLGSGRPELQGFLIELGDLLENRIPASLRARLEQTDEGLDFSYERQRFRVILSLREDFLPQLERLGALIPSVLVNRMRLERMHGGQALEAVLKPAPDLVDDTVGRAIVAFVAGADESADASAVASSAGDADIRLTRLEVEPAILSVVLRVLNEKRIEAGQDKISADLLTMSRQRILGDFYEQALADLPAGVGVFIEEHLLTKGGFRNTVPCEEALEQITDGQLSTLVDRRLLRVEDRLGVAHVELTHDVLTRVIRASRDRRREAEKQEAALRQERELAERMAAERAAYRRRFRLALTSAIAIALLSLAAAWAAYDIFWREHVEYYTGFVNRWGGVVGRGRRLSAAEARQRNVSFKMVRVGRNLLGRSVPYTRLEVVDAGGNLQPDYNVPLLLNVGDDNPDSRPCLWEFMTDRQGAVTATKYYNQKRQLVMGFVYSPSTSATLSRGRFIAPDGYALNTAESAAEYVEISHTPGGYPALVRYLDAGGNPAPGPKGVFVMKRSYDAGGLILAATALDDQGAPMNDRNAVCTTRYQYNDLGRVTRADYYDTHSQRTNSREGYSAVVSEYDPLGRMLAVAYFDKSGHPALIGINPSKPLAVVLDPETSRIRTEETLAFSAKTSPSGNETDSTAAAGAAEEGQGSGRGRYHRAKMAYDDRGNPVRTAFFDVQDSPTLHSVIGVHEIRCDYDERGRKVAERYFNTSGEPMLSAQWVHEVRLTYDERGNLARSDYRGKDGKPTLHQEGYAAQVMAYDEAGNLIEKSWFDEEGRPTLDKTLYVHRIRWERDGAGRPLCESYWNLDGRPMDRRRGCHRIVMRRDNRGNLLERRTFDAEGQPVMEKLGATDSACLVRREFDNHGNVTRLALFDDLGRPIVKKGYEYASIAYRYDRWNHLTEVAYFNTEGRPVSWQPESAKDRLAHRQLFEYDRFGILTRASNRDDAGNLVGTSRTVALLRLEHDERGNLSAAETLDQMMKPVSPGFFYAGDMTLYVKTGRQALAYDALDRETSRRNLDREGKPTVDKEGVHEIRVLYDERGHLMGEDHCDLEGKLTGISARYRFDLSGRYILEQAYFDKEGKPASLNTVYSMAKNINLRDDRNLTSRSFSYGLSTSGTLRLVSEMRLEYDRRGNPVEMMSYGPDGRLRQSLRERKRFDLFGNAVESVFFNTDGKPVINDRGINRSDSHRIVREYDADNRLVREAHFGLQGEPILCAKRYHARVIQPDRTLYYDLQGKAYPEAVMVTHSTDEVRAAGLREGDCILACDGTRVLGAAQFGRLKLDAYRQQRPIALQLWRKGRETTVTLPVDLVSSSIGRSWDFGGSVAPPELGGPPRLAQAIADIKKFVRLGPWAEPLGIQVEDFLLTIDGKWESSGDVLSGKNNNPLFDDRRYHFLVAHDGAIRLYCVKREDTGMIFYNLVQPTEEVRAGLVKASAAATSASLKHPDQEAFYDMQGRLRTDPKAGWAIRCCKYDADNNLREEVYLDDRERPVLNHQTGSHHIMREYDPEARTTVDWNYGIAKEAHFGVKGEPVDCKEGYHAYTVKYGDYGVGKPVMVDARGTTLPTCVVVGTVKPGGQGKELGIQLGDAIISYDGVKIESVDQLAAMVMNSTPDMPERKAVFWRAGKDLTVTMKGGSSGCYYLPRPAPPELAARLAREPQGRKYVPPPVAPKPIKITSIWLNGLAEQKGIKPGDAVVSFGGVTPRNPVNLQTLFVRHKDAAASGAPKTVVIQQGDRITSFSIPAGTGAGIVVLGAPANTANADVTTSPLSTQAKKAKKKAVSKK